MQLTLEDTFELANYGGELFEVKPMKVAYALRNDQVDPLTEEGKHLQDLVVKQLKAVMAQFKAEREKQLKDAIMFTETSLLKTAHTKRAQFKGDDAKLVKWMEEERKGALVMIKNAVATFEATAKKKILEVYKAAAAEVDKRFKTKIVAMSVMAGFRIVQQVAILLTATAVSTVAAVVGVLATIPTGGLSFSVVAGAVLGELAVLATTGYNIYQACNKTWPSYQKSLTSLTRAWDDLTKAVTKTIPLRNKQQKGHKLGTVDSIKLVLTNVGGKRKAVLDAMGEVGTWAGLLAQDVEKMAHQIKDLESRIESLGKAAQSDDSKAVVAARKRIAAMKEERDALEGKIEVCRMQIKQGKARWVEAKKLLDEHIDDPKLLGKFLTELQAFCNEPAIGVFISNFGTVVKGVGTTAKGLMAMAK